MDYLDCCKALSEMKQFMLEHKDNKDISNALLGLLNMSQFIALIDEAKVSEAQHWQLMTNAHEWMKENGFTGE